MNVATNPSNANSADNRSAGDGSASVNTSWTGTPPEDEQCDLDRRTHAQRLLDGLVGACKTALATGVLPTTGGLRPQVMVTIDYQDLLSRLETSAAEGPSDITQSSGASNWGASNLRPRPVVSHPGISHPGSGTGSGTFIHTGPVSPATIRKIACDADIIPVVLGGNGRVLDVGRTTRIFPSHIRKALTARDQGCAFPNCTIPATWCEAHHITYWSRGGSTSTDNGVLLCTHHHHLVHKEQWKIQVTSGVPWFIPPPHIDPKQEPRQNHHHRT